ncbi:unnamed protein product [Gordionus sp. m RMFG-2023]
MNLFLISLIIVFDELKNDFKNPIDQCKSLNPLILPEYILHAFMSFFLLIAGHWILFLLNIPIIGYNIFRYKNRPLMSCPGIHDPTNVLNSNYLKYAQIEGWSKLGFQIFVFFIYLYCLIYYLVSE